MSKDISVEEAAAIIASAFAPLRCVAEPWDYDERVRFRVFNDSDDPLLTVEDLHRQQVTDLKRLESIINQSRDNLTERGFSLSPWSIGGR